MIRNAADTEVPMIPPTLLNEPNLELMAEAVAATTTDVITTILAKEGVSEYNGTWSLRALFGTKERQLLSVR